MSELMEELAAIEHERWADWMRYLFSKAVPNAYTKNLSIMTNDIERWERQIATPYADLSEEDKEKDREQVRRYLPLFEQRIAALTGDIKFLLPFVPLKSPPEKLVHLDFVWGLTPSSVYYTKSYEGDLELWNRVESLRENQQ